MTMKLKKVGVLGAGTTGKGLIRCLAGSGLDVVFCELSKEQVDQAIAQITDDLDVEKAKWGVTESEKRLILSRIAGSTDMREMAGSQVIIEVIKGDLEAKQEVFQDMDQLFSADTVLVSSSPTLCVSDIARKIAHPDRVVAMHFPLPVQARPIVEIVRGDKTSDRTIEVARLLAKLMKKKTFEVFEMPGLITTRIMIPYINEAMHIVMEGLANAEHVDEAVRLGFSLPIGPLAMPTRWGSTPCSTTWRTSSTLWATCSTALVRCCAAWCAKGTGRQERTRVLCVRRHRTHSGKPDRDLLKGARCTDSGCPGGSDGPCPRSRP
jgi:3-hydroxybutyryl-CoA dehydrogenase